MKRLTPFIVLFAIFMFGCGDTGVRSNLNTSSPGPISNVSQSPSVNAPSPAVTSNAKSPQPTVASNLARPTPIAKTTNSVANSGTATKLQPEPPGHPAGATAKCKDGTLSYSAHRQGTCSHHGGVAEWY